MDYSVLWPGHPLCAGERKLTLFLAEVSQGRKESGFSTPCFDSIQTLCSSWRSLSVLWLEGVLWRKVWWAAQEFVFLMSQAGATPEAEPSPRLVAGDRTGLEEGAAPAGARASAAHRTALPSCSRSAPCVPWHNSSSTEDLTCQIPDTAIRTQNSNNIISQWG